MRLMGSSHVVLAQSLKLVHERLPGLPVLFVKVCLGEFINHPPQSPINERSRYGGALIEDGAPGQA